MKGKECEKVMGIHLFSQLVGRESQSEKESDPELSNAECCIIIIIIIIEEMKITSQVD